MPTPDQTDGKLFYVQDQIDVTDRLQVRLGLRWDDFEQDLTNLRADPVATTSSPVCRPSSAQFWVIFARQFDPNITESAEIGLKLDAAHLYDGISGALNVAVFRVEQSNILVNDDRPMATAAGFSRWKRVKPKSGT